MQCLCPCVELKIHRARRIVKRFHAHIKLLFIPFIKKKRNCIKSYSYSSNLSVLQGLIHCLEKTTDTRSVLGPGTPSLTVSIPLVSIRNRNVWCNPEVDRIRHFLLWQLVVSCQLFGLWTNVSSFKASYFATQDSERIFFYF